MVNRRKTYKNILSCWQLYLLILPAVVYLFIFNYIPMAGVQIAFRDYKVSKGIWGSDWVNLKHFIRFFNYPNCWKIIRNTLSITLYSLLTFPLPLVFAVMLNELQSIHLKKTAQMISYAPHFISTVVICSIITLFMNREHGMINHFIALLGGTRRSFLSEPQLFSSIYVWSDVWQNLGWDSIIYISALAAVSPELYESAQIDGANRIQKIIYIDIPSVLPTFVILLIMRVGKIMSLGFEKIFLLQNSLNLDVSQVLSTYIYDVGMLKGQFSYSTAIGLFNNVINLFLLLMVNYISQRLSDTSLL